MLYVPTSITTEPNLSRYVERELQEISRAWVEPDDFHWLRTLTAAPKKIRAGMIVLADGTNWNPGSGAGVYCYYSGAWNKLG